MFIIWLGTFFLSLVNWLPAVQLWHWFGVHWIVTILLLIFLG